MQGLKTKHQSPIIKQIANFNEFDKRLYYSSIYFQNILTYADGVKIKMIWVQVHKLHFNEIKATLANEQYLSLKRAQSRSIKEDLLTEYIHEMNRTKLNRDQTFCWFSFWKWHLNFFQKFGPCLNITAARTTYANRPAKIVNSRR